MAIIILRIIFAIIWGILAGLGLFYLIRIIVDRLGIKSTLHWNQRISIPIDVQKSLNREVGACHSLNDTGSLVGKIIDIDGDKYLVLSSTIKSISQNDPQDSTFDIVLYRDGKIYRQELGSNKSTELYNRYCTQKPVKSREIRRDVRKFCSNQCILDCTDCVLRKYGKSNSSSK